MCYNCCRLMFARILGFFLAGDKGKHANAVSRTYTDKERHIDACPTQIGLTSETSPALLQLNKFINHPTIAFFEIGRASCRERVL